MIVGDAREIPVPDGFFHCAVTSPPYWGLRDYGHAGQLGLEPTPEQYVANMVEVCREARRVLRDDGTLWLNLGDCYQNAKGQAGGVDPKQPARRHGLRPNDRSIPGLKPKDLVGIPWRVAFALQADGWWLRDCIVWDKPNAMPSSVTDRTTTSHEYVFLLAKARRYFYDADAIREPITSTGGACFGKQNISADGTKSQSRKLTDASERNNPLGRNKRSVWRVTTNAFAGAHFATFPPRLIEPCIKAGTSEHGCCPACGAPWRRVVEKSREFGSGSGRAGNMPVGKNGANMQGGGATLDIRRGPLVSTFTTGWQPTCKCPDAEPVPCRVLDMFGGAGTTPMVAARLGRIGYGIERKHDYAVMARDRCADDAANPLKLKRPKRPKPVPRGQAELFPAA
jgi:DNA modification methylase